jgi:hypothetical protein
MPRNALTRRAALLSLGAFASAGLAGCNTTPTGGVQPGTASGLSIGAIEVDTTPLAYVAIRPRAGRSRLCPARSPRLWARVRLAGPRFTCASTRSIWAAADRPIPTG